MWKVVSNYPIIQKLENPQIAVLLHGLLFGCIYLVKEVNRTLYEMLENPSMSNNLYLSTLADTCFNFSIYVKIVVSNLQKPSVEIVKKVTIFFTPQYAIQKTVQQHLLEKHIY